MPLPHQLYAVVSKFENTTLSTTPPAAKRPLAVVKREKLAELKQKKAIDRANACIDRLELRMVEIDAQIAALQRRKKCCTARIARIEDRFVQELEAWGLTRADGFQTGVLLTPSPASVEVFDETILPAEYWRQPKTPAKQPDKVAIKAALTQERKVPGARLLQGNTLRRS
jgi:hypothetical protein